MASPCSAKGRQDSPLHMHRVRMMDNGHKVLLVIYCTERLKIQGLKACSRTFCDQIVHVFINYNTLSDLSDETLTARELNVTKFPIKTHKQHLKTMMSLGSGKRNMHDAPFEKKKKNTD